VQQLVEPALGNELEHERNVGRVQHHAQQAHHLRVVQRGAHGCLPQKRGHRLRALDLLPVHQLDGHLAVVVDPHPNLAEAAAAHPLLKLKLGHAGKLALHVRHELHERRVRQRALHRRLLQLGRGFAPL
jgi:hypothetical protein